MQTSKARRVLGRLMERVLGDVLKMGCFVHRFLISGLDLGIDASFSRFKPSCVYRFLISGPDLGIDASFSPIKHSSVHRFLISGLDLRIDAALSSLCVRAARLQHYRRCCKEEWFRLQHHRCCTEERPAFRMTVADAACPAATTFALRFHLSPPQRHSASGSIFLRRNVIWPLVPSFSAATKTVLRPEPTKTDKKRGGRHGHPFYIKV